MYSYRVFCCGKTGEDSVSGILETMIPLKPGQIHTIKGRKWCCDWVDVNMEEELIANFREAEGSKWSMILKNLIY